MEAEMTSRVLEKSEWQSYFEKFAKATLGKQSHIEIIGPELGDQVLVNSIRMLGIAYEPKADLLEIALKGHDHLVPHPQKITVEEKDGMLVSFQVIDGEGQQQVVELRPAILL
jgi:hypothetical protein